MQTLVGERKKEVPGQFDRVARTYDLLTGMNPGYRKHLGMSAERLKAPSRGARILDLCCGTGLSTSAVVRAYPEASVVALDASAGMLERAQRKHELSKVQFVLGDAQNPAASGIEGPFDAILMAYGIRNVPDADACLHNLLPLLRPGGTICFHEYSVADSRAAQLLWSAVCYGVIIPGGLMTAGDVGLYRYLRRSVVEFDGVRAFEARLARAGYDRVRTERMDGWQRGIVHSFLAQRPRLG
jgi:ubiquinone/menaquinone biosynthesis C-methylase UbiE